MLTEVEAIELLNACKPLADRLNALPHSTTPNKIVLAEEDLKLLEGFVRVRNDTLVAGPGLLGKLYKAADLTQPEIYKLESVIKLLAKRIEKFR